MPTPIEELTAREQAEGATHTTGPANGQPIQPELVPPPIVATPVAPAPAPVYVPVETSVRGFIHHVEDEVEEFVRKR